MDLVALNIIDYNKISLKKWNFFFMNEDECYNWYIARGLFLSVLNTTFIILISKLIKTTSYFNC